MNNNKNNMENKDKKYLKNCIGGCIQHQPPRAATKPVYNMQHLSGWKENCTVTGLLEKLQEGRH